MEHATRQKVKDSMDHLQRSRSVPAYIDDQPLQRMGVDGSIPATNFVPPPAGLHATSFVPSISKVIDDHPSCLYEGSCSARINECGGRNAGQCTYVNCNLIQIPADDEEFESMKTAAQKRRRAEELKEKRANKKKQ
jgi:hypothetical protein